MAVVKKISRKVTTAINNDARACALAGGDGLAFAETDPQIAGFLMSGGLYGW